MQSAYLKVVDGRASYSGQSEFRGFLFGVIRRTALEEHRRGLLRRTLSLGLITEPAIEHGGLDPIVRTETTARLVAALTQLAPRQREVLHLVFYQELSIAEAADVMSVSLGSARVHYERGKARLRQLLGDD